MRPEELEYAKEREQARELRLAELKGQLAVADNATAEVARVAADAAAAACAEVPCAPGLESSTAHTDDCEPEPEPEPEPDPMPGWNEEAGGRMAGGGRKRKSAGLRVLESVAGEDMSWMEDSDDDAPFFPFP
eukprot:628172-Prymnesium_polylepis.1